MSVLPLKIKLQCAASIKCVKKKEIIYFKDLYKEMKKVPSCTDTKGFPSRALVMINNLDQDRATQLLWKGLNPIICKSNLYQTSKSLLLIH